MRFGVRVPANRPIGEVVATVRRAEAAGFDAAWFPDSHLNYREVWATLGAVAVSTERIEIGPTVTNLATRHVTVTASAARAIAEVAAGRFILGLGAGDSALGFDGLRNASVAEMAEGVGRLRELTAGEGVTFGDFEAKLRGADVRVPVYLAASGPRTLAMAGAVADGVIIMMGNVAAKLAHVRRGAAEAGRQPPPVFIYTTGAITDDLERISKAFKTSCIRIAQLEGREIFEAAGVRVELPPGEHRMGAPGDLGHAANIEEVAAQVDHLVSDEAALWFASNRALVGSEADIEAHFARLQDQGIAGVTMTQLSGSKLPDLLIETIGPLARRFAARAAPQPA